MELKLKKQFQEIVRLVQEARYDVLKKATVELFQLYWKVGENIHKKVQRASWNKNVVQQLADYIRLYWK